MFINEVAEGSAVMLEVKTKDGKEMTLETQVIGVFEAGEYKMAFVEALRHEGRLLTFDSVTCYAYITNAEDNKIYKYKLKGIIKREKDGQVYHCLISNDDVAEENRRGAKRFGVSAKGTIQLLGNTSSLRGYVRDISATGISFLVADSKLDIGDKVSISFEHEITGAQIKVIAEIVRCVEQEKGTLFGCQVHKHDAKFTMLISYLMRQECKVRS